MLPPPPHQLTGVYREPCCHRWGRGAASSLPGLALHRRRGAPGAPSEEGLKETLAGSQLLPCRPAARRGGEAGRLVGVLRSLDFREAGARRVPGRAPLGRPLPAPACCLLSQALAADRRRLEFCPNRGAGGGVEEGRRPAARNGIRSPEPHGEERSGGGGGSGGSAAPARPQCISEAVRTCSGWLPPGSMHWLTGSQPPRDLF